VGDDERVSDIARLAAGVMAATAGFGGAVMLFIAMIQLDGDVCGYLAEQECAERRLDFDSALTLVGVGCAIVTAVAGLGCAVTARRAHWRVALLAFVGAAAVGLTLEILDIPNR
jgi:uncharacterized membrane protein YfcA